jgi:twitching motility protein PilT
MELHDILKAGLQSGASDIHIKAGMPPIFRVNGGLYPMQDAQRMAPEFIGKLAQTIMTPWQREQFEKTNECDLSYGVPGLGRFRVNIFQQRGAIGMVMRCIPFKILPMAELSLPPIIERIAAEERGLILVTGTTGSGKSTTLASMIDHINTTRSVHIMTIEDPIEYLIRDKRSIVNQREVGQDTRNFSAALRSALRQDPDVILVGEMRDLETMEIALTAAETGHLVLSTLHTTDATESITRIVSAFPPHQQGQVRLQLGGILRAIISQRLVPRADGRGRVPAVEVLINTAYMREMIEDETRVKEMREAIAKGYDTYGMQTFDQSLMWLLHAGYITYEEAMRQASNPDDFALRLAGIGSTSDGRWDRFESQVAPTTAASSPRPQSAGGAGGVGATQGNIANEPTIIHGSERF